MAEIPHVEKPVTEYAEKRGYIVRKCQWTGRRGAPDRLFLGKGKGFFVEFKDTDKKAEPHQLREIQRMRDAGFTVHVISDVEAGKKLFD